MTIFHLSGSELVLPGRLLWFLLQRLSGWPERNRPIPSRPCENRWGRRHSSKTWESYFPNILGFQSHVYPGTLEATESGALKFLHNGNFKLPPLLSTDSGAPVGISLDASRVSSMYQNDINDVRVNALFGLHLIRAYQWQSVQGINTNLCETGLINGRTSWGVQRCTEPGLIWNNRCSVRRWINCVSYYSEDAWCLSNYTSISEMRVNFACDIRLEGTNEIQAE